MNEVLICLDANFFGGFHSRWLFFYLIPRWVFMFICSCKSIDGTLLVGNDRTPMKDCGGNYSFQDWKGLIFSFIISIR